LKRSFRLLRSEDKRSRKENHGKGRLKEAQTPAANSGKTPSRTDRGGDGGPRPGLRSRELGSGGRGYKGHLLAPTGEGREQAAVTDAEGERWQAGKKKTGQSSPETEPLSSRKRPARSGRCITLKLVDPELEQDN